jgi:hypothetical protein
MTYGSPGGVGDTRARGWAVGVGPPEPPEGQPNQELYLKVSDVLVSDSTDTKFGTLPGTELSGHLRAPVEDVRRRPD